MGQKWPGAGLAGPGHSHRDQEVRCALSCLPGTLFPSRPPHLDHTLCTKAAQRGPNPVPLPQPCTPNPAPCDGLSGKQPSQPTTHSLNQSLADVPRLEKTHRCSHSCPLVSMQTPKYKEPVSVHSDNLKSAQSHKQSYPSNPVNSHTPKHTPTASLLAPTCSVTGCTQTPIQKQLLPSGSQVPESHTNTYQSCTVSHSQP